MRTSTAIALALAGVAAPVLAAPMFLESRSISDDLSQLSSLEDPDDLRFLFDNGLIATGPLPTREITSSSLSKVARKISSKTGAGATKGGKGSGSAAPKSSSSSSSKGSGFSSTKGSGTPSSKPTTKKNDPPTSSSDNGSSTLDKILELGQNALPFLNSLPFSSQSPVITEPIPSTDPAVSGDTTVNDGNSTVTDTGSNSTDTASSELDRRDHFKRQLTHKVKRELMRMLMERAFADLD